MKKTSSFLLATTFFLFFILTLNSANAVSILIGDVDGFGIDPTGLVAANGDPADTNGNGIIESGEFLPDWNTNGTVAYGSYDYFDSRSASELASTDGAQWTDYSLINLSADDAFFTFDFTLNMPTLGDSDYGVDHYINLLFGDYELAPMSLSIDGTVHGLSPQSNIAGEDGLVQLAYAVVPWADMLDGIVTIDVIAPNEQYIALDYAYLNTENTAPSVEPVPEPATVLLLGTGLIGLAGVRRKMKK